LTSPTLPAAEDLNLPDSLSICICEFVPFKLCRLLTAHPAASAVATTHTPYTTHSKSHNITFCIVSHPQDTSDPVISYRVAINLLIPCVPPYDSFILHSEKSRRYIDTVALFLTWTLYYQPTHTPTALLRSFRRISSHPSRPHFA